MEISSDFFSVVCFAASLVVVFLLIRLYSTIVLEPEKIRRKLKVQGIKGPPTSFFHGNLPEMEKLQKSIKGASYTNRADCVAHDYTSTLFPYFEQWRKDYGSIYTYSTGMRQHMYVNKPELVKEMNQSITLDLGKPPYLTKKLAPMLGNGILRSNGLVWAHQRKIVAPEFYMDKVKGMVGLMVMSTQPLVQKWEGCIEALGGTAADVRVDEDLREVSADVISRACFGSSYVEGKQIFSKLRSLQKAISTQSLPFSATSFGSRLFPTKKQSQIDGLEREIESLIWDAVKERKQENLESGSSLRKDLMQLMLERAMNDETLSKDSSKRFIIDNCKTIYFAGHESTAVAASWCLMLLALHPEWQHSIRTELAQVCSDHIPNANSLSQMKKLTMVIQETLRLYPPGAFVSREAFEDTQIGGIIVPKGVCLWTLIPTLHRDPDNWGLDANEFRPERFSEGVNKSCKYPQAYIPFGVGPRVCLGKNFAMVQLKVILSMIVSKFQFSLSPNYHHSPAYRMIVEPGHGVQILVQKI